MLRKDLFLDMCTQPAAAVIFFHSGGNVIVSQMLPISDDRQLIFQQKHIQCQTANLTEASRKKNKQLHERSF